MGRRRLIKGGASLAGVLLVPGLAACASDDDDGASPTPTAGTGATGTATAAAPGEPTAGGIFKTVYRTPTPNLNIAQESSFAVHGAVSVAYNRLLKYTAGDGHAFSNIEIEGDLAEDWSGNADGTEYTFKLRPGIRFHDIAPVSGRELTSEDVVYSAEFVMDPANQSPNASIYDGVVSVTAPDDQTVVFTLDGPNAEFLDNIANHYGKVFPRELAESGGMMDKAIGTGPFVLEEYDPSVGMKFGRNPNYFREGRPYLDGIEWSVVGDYSAQLAALRSQQIDAGPYCCGPELRDIPDLQAALGDTYNFHEGIRSNGDFLALRGPAGDDPRVRHAISLAVDREPLLDACHDGLGVLQAHVPVAIDRFTLPEDETQALYGAPDLDEARRLLAAAGYEDGLALTMIAPDSENARVLQQLVQADLRKVGIDVTLTPVDRATYFERMAAGDFELANFQGSTSWSLNFWLAQLHATGAGRNWWGYSSEEFDALARKIGAELDADQRQEDAFAAQRLLAEDLPTIPLGQGPQVFPSRKTLQGFAPHWTYGLPALEKSWFNA